ncbi:hypothetical protein VNI00_009799 [Paramarasmius palmivorus]|uniref:Uncharacterized protein n=1 Tax=Paramarasmius palmivorus TaxID=297713 RepID=A0AAW0CNV0_9AGAR
MATLHNLNSRTRLRGNAGQPTNAFHDIDLSDTPVRRPEPSLQGIRVIRTALVHTDDEKSTTLERHASNIEHNLDKEVEERKITVRRDSSSQAATV